MDLSGQSQVLQLNRFMNLEKQKTNQKQLHLVLEESRNQGLREEVQDVREDHDLLEEEVHLRAQKICGIRSQVILDG